MDPIAYPSPRVSQLDSSILDNELLTLMKQHLASVFQLQTNKWWGYDQHPELWDLVLNLLLFRITVWKTGSSYGLSLQNLKLVNFRNGKLIGYSKRSLLLALIVGDYLYKKLQSYLYATEEADISRQNDGLWKAMKMFVVRHKDVLLNKAEHTFKVLNMVNFTLFLLNGKYPSLVHRVLGMSLTPIITDLLRFNGDNVNYEFQNRQLVWNVMTEFLVFILPLLQLKKLRTMSKKLISVTRNNDKQSVSDDTDSATITPYSSLPMSQCAVCHRNKDYALMAGEKKTTSVSCMVTNPYVVNCGHIYCYVCAASLFNALEVSDNDEGCLRCGKKLLWFKKYGEEEEDIDEDAIMVEYEEEEEEEKDDDEEKDNNSDNNNNSDSDSDSDNDSDSEDEKNKKLNEKSDSESSDYSEGEDYDNDNYEDNFDNFDDANVDYDDNIEL